MQDLFVRRMSESDVRSDTRLLGDFAGIYCRGVHPDAPRRALSSDGATLGVYGRRIPVVCEECAELLSHAERRRAMCPKSPKPFCSNCDTHCYSPVMRDRMREVMRYAGPRSMFTRHALAGVKHLLESRRTASETRRDAAAETNEEEL